MDNNKLTGRMFWQQTTGKKLANDMWEVEVVMSERVYYPDGTSKEESITSMGIDQDFDLAHQLALSSALTELGQIVYQRGFDSLIEGKEYQRKLEANDNSETYKDTSTQ